MIIQNKTTDRQEYISQKQWEKLVKLGYQKNWRIIDSSDDQAPQDKETPKKIIDFAQMSSRNMPEKEPELPDNPDDMRALLDELGIKYHPRHNMKSLINLYNQYKSNQDGD